jgi:hypothetical protein
MDWEDALRTFIQSEFPALTEERKWLRPMWTYKGELVCGVSSLKRGAKLHLFVETGGPELELQRWSQSITSHNLLLDSDTAWEHATRRLRAAVRLRK